MVKDGENINNSKLPDSSGIPLFNSINRIFYYSILYDKGH